MLVQCPNCQTTYRVSDSLIATSNPTFRCSRCKHIFALGSDLQREPSSEALSHRRDQTSNDDREPSFSFPPRETGVNFSSPQPSEESWTEEETERRRAEETFDSSDTQDERPLRSHEETPLSVAREDGTILGGEDDQGSISPARAQEASFEEEAFPLPQDEEPQQMEMSAEPVEQDPRDSPASVIPYLYLFGALLLVYSLLMLTHRTQPTSMEKFLKNIPWLGSSMLKNDHLRSHIAIESLRPGFQKILGNREVFLVAGTAINRNPVGVRGVQIEGAVYDAQGREIERHAVSVGNAISLKIIRDLTAQEISILQKLSPQKRFEISAEQSAKFVVVFFKSQGEIKSFSCRIVAAEGRI